ncbi:Receptor-like protein EIX1 [Glycine max]|nr:Receptor-like protein EIX1 [Glycine max]
MLDFYNNSIGVEIDLKVFDHSLNCHLMNISKLSSLHIDGNLFQRVVKENDLRNLTSLKEFHASGNNFTLKVGPNWLPNFQLTSLDVLYLNLSYNHIHGELGTTLKNPLSIHTIDLSSNHLCGKLSYLSSDVFRLDLSSNSFSESMKLEFLNLASNNLSGEIPNCWMIWPFLVEVNSQSNHSVGNLPSSMGMTTEIEMRTNFTLSLFCITNLVFWDEFYSVYVSLHNFGRSAGKNV